MLTQKTIQKIGGGLYTNEYGIPYKFTCMTCKKHFDQPNFMNEDQSESGYGSCPYCCSQLHTGNFDEEEMFDLTRVKIGDIIDHQDYLWNLFKVEAFVEGDPKSWTKNGGVLLRGIGTQLKAIVWFDENIETKSYKRIPNIDASEVKTNYKEVRF